MMKKYLRTLGLIAIITGASLLAVIGIIAMWGDIEATVLMLQSEAKNLYPPYDVQLLSHLRIRHLFLRAFTIQVIENSKWKSEHMFRMGTSFY